MLGVLKGLSESTGIRIVNFGHAGDGNIHVNLMVDKNNKDEYAKALKLVGTYSALPLSWAARSQESTESA